MHFLIIVGEEQTQPELLRLAVIVYRVEAFVVRISRMVILPPQFWKYTDLVGGNTETRNGLFVR